MAEHEPWWLNLAKQLLGLLTKQALGAAGATPDQMASAQIVQAELPSFYTAPEPPAGVKESRSLDHCEPELARRYRALEADFLAETGRQLFVTCTWRSAERQAELYAQGRTTPGDIVTWIDGTTKRSRHNFYPSQAIDVAVDVDPGPGKTIVWDKPAYLPLGALALKHGLRWGGDWNGNGKTEDERRVDMPHLELPGEAMWG